jgi:hypothetical protein
MLYLLREKVCICRLLIAEVHKKAWVRQTNQQSVTFAFSPQVKQ